LSQGSTYSQSEKQQLSEDAVNIRRCWVVTVPNAGVSAVSSDAKSVFVASTDGQILSIEAKTGNRNWISELGGKVISPLFVSASKVFIATNSTNGGDQTTLWALSKETGITIWNSKIPFSENIYIGGGNGIFSITHDGSISRFDSETGVMSWNKKINSEIAAEPIFADSIIIGSKDKHIYILDSTIGEITSSPVTSVPFFVSGSLKNGVLFGDDRGNITKWTADSAATSWKFKAGAKITQAFRTNEGILAASDDNFIYFISDYNGDVIWKLRLSGRVNDLIMLSDKLAAASAVGENEVVIFDLSNGKPVTKLAAKHDNSIVNLLISINGSSIIAVNNFDLEFLSLNGCTANQTPS